MKKCQVQIAAEVIGFANNTGTEMGKNIIEGNVEPNTNVLSVV